MKKSILIFFIIALTFACKKNNQQQAQPNPPPQQNVNQPPPMTQTEQALLGYWIMDSMALYTYSTSTRVSGNVYTNSLTCIMNFKSSPMNSDWYPMQDGHNFCTLVETIWKAPNAGQFQIGAATFPITMLTSTVLRFTWGVSQSYEQRYYLHK